MWFWMEELSCLPVRVNPTLSFRPLHHSRQKSGAVYIMSQCPSPTINQ